MGSRHDFGGGDTASAINLHLQQVARARLFLDGFQAERPLSRRERRTIDEWALYTSLVWADFITKQGRHGAAMRVLTAAQSHLGAAEGRDDT